MDSRINLHLSNTFHLKGADTKKQEETKTADTMPQVSLTHREAEQIWNAMGTMGLAFKGLHGLGEINPSKYLSPERIADIQQSMVAFQGGVDGKMNALEEEFGQLPEYANLNEAGKLEMAAKLVLEEQA